MKKGADYLRKPKLEGTKQPGEKIEKKQAARKQKSFIF